jgi:hypothetical protein
MITNRITSYNGVEGVEVTTDELPMVTDDDDLSG